MNLEIKGIHYHISDPTMEFIEKKLQRIDFAKEYLVDVSVTVTKESHGYKVDGKAHFRWGVHIVASEEAHELYEAIELMMDKFEKAIRKEKKKKVDKKVDHKHSADLQPAVILDDDDLDDDDDLEEIDDFA